jgi:hypothetical protein
MIWCRWETTAESTRDSDLSFEFTRRSSKISAEFVSLKFSAIGLAAMLSSKITGTEKIASLKRALDDFIAR